MKIFLKTFGCQMNFRDSEFVMGVMLERGFERARSMKDADVILFNSCSVRKHAEDRLFSNIAELKDLKKARPALVIGLIGCTAQSYKEKALHRAPLVDFVCGPGNIAEIPAIVKDVAKHRCPIIASDGVTKPRPELFPKFRDGGFKAYVSIGEGCSNFCSYCIVPYVRGPERSRDSKDIIKEVRDLSARGFKEILLLGQNVNSYKPDFVKLLKKIDKIKGIKRIRFMTSHPKDASPELFKAIADLENVCEHLHLPMQSGSDRILKLMNRGYARDKYLRLVDAYRKSVPDGALTTDIIVGFPSEGEKDFEATHKVVEHVGFDGAFVFKYSPRPPAEATTLNDDVPDEVKGQRTEELLTLQCRISDKANAAYAGKTVEVLVDGSHDKAEGILAGRTRTNKVAVFKGPPALIGKFVNVRIESATPHALKGRIAD